MKIGGSSDFNFSRGPEKLKTHQQETFDAKSHRENGFLANTLLSHIHVEVYSNDKQPFFFALLPKANSHSTKFMQFLRKNSN